TLPIRRKDAKKRKKGQLDRGFWVGVAVFRAPHAQGKGPHQRPHKLDRIRHTQHYPPQNHVDLIDLLRLWRLLRTCQVWEREEGIAPKRQRGPHWHSPWAFRPQPGRLLSVPHIASDALPDPGRLAAYP